MRFARIPLGPMRGVLTDETERAIDAALAGPLPEMVGRAIVEQRVLERVITEMLQASAQRQAGPDGTGGRAPIMGSGSASFGGRKSVGTSRSGEETRRLPALVGSVNRN